MLESALNSSIIYYIMGAITIGGIVSKLIVSMSLKNLVRAASDMSKSTNRLMKLVRAKFEHACMVNDQVENVDVFVEKYMREHQVLGIRLYGWQRLERIFIVILGLLTIYIGGATYYYAGFGQDMLRRMLIGAGLFLLLLGIYQFVDEKLRMQTMKVYMVDYLENVCAKRYARTNGMKEKVIIPSAASMSREEQNAAEKLEEQMSNIEWKHYLQKEQKEQKEQREQKEEMGIDRNLVEEIEHIGKSSVEGTMNEKSILQKRAMEEAEKRQELKRQKQEEYMPNEATIREILQEFMA